jgi:hypothetical protein
MSRMTAAERQELGKLVRLNAKVAKDDAEARGKWMLADAEAKLAARFKQEDQAWADITEAVEKQIAEANAAVNAIAAQRGIHEDFRPSVNWYWDGRGENKFKERRDELRKVAQAQVAARVKQAQVEIDRQAAEQLTCITQSGLTSEEARAFISAMPKPEHLLPPLGSLELHNGELVLLNGPVTATPDAAPVTPAVTAAETDKRFKCAFCGQPFTPNRSDSKFCKPACRVADYRRRHAEQDA